MAPPCAPRPKSQVVPLTADLRRLHLTVTAGFIEQVAKARTGLSHALPGATIEQVLEAALAALLEKQARRKGLGKRALRAARAEASTPAAPSPRATPLAPSPLTLTPIPDRPHVPADLERAVRLRDGGRCQNPLDSGGVCGSTWQVELDQDVPVALGGATTLANLRCLCRVHNRAAAREALGQAAELRRPPACPRRQTPSAEPGNQGLPQGQTLTAELVRRSTRGLLRQSAPIPPATPLHAHEVARPALRQARLAPLT